MIAPVTYGGDFCILLYLEYIAQLPKTVGICDKKQHFCAILLSVNKIRLSFEVLAW